MNIADRIQSLRKSKGISQEELADKIGVSRQAVSKWESEQSLPDMEKVILLSDYFEVTTDYLLKGIEPTPEASKKKVDAGIFTVMGSALNIIGLIASIIIWIEERRPVSVAVGLIVMAVGCTIFALGQCIGENRKKAAFYFGVINVWLLGLIPISCMFNCVQGVLGGYWWTFTPIPQLGNSRGAYGLCWFLYVVVCVVADIVFVKRRNRQKCN